jgi:hypothetical protein
MMAFFLLSPSKNKDVAALQSEMGREFSVAWQQTIGDQPYFEEFAVIFDGVRDFYEESATAMVALIEDKEMDRDLAFVFKTAYQDFGQIITGQRGWQPTHVAEAKQAPSMGLITPTAWVNLPPATISESGFVAGAVLDNSPVNIEKPWVTLKDNLTGQLYCVAFYNGELNKYLGPCANDYH